MTITRSTNRNPAVIDSGIDAAHPHFSELELAAEGRVENPPQGSTSGLHRDFSFLVNPDNPVQPVAALSAAAGSAAPPAPAAASALGSPAAPDTPAALVDDSGHGTHVAGGRDPGPDVPAHRGERGPGSAACVNQLVASGVIVVVSAGNYGARTAAGDSANTSAIMGSVTEPAHAQDCIAVGSTHRDAPHAFGVTWTSGKGPTLDGRMKPDVVAPGEWIASAATGEIRAQAGLDPRPTDAVPADPASRRDQLLTYAEQSGTSMAAPHVSGVIAAFLSARPEFIGRPQQVKSLLTDSATDLGRERYAQGAGLADLMRMLMNV